MNIILRPTVYLDGSTFTNKTYIVSKKYIDSYFLIVTLFLIPTRKSVECVARNYQCLKSIFPNHAKIQSQYSQNHAKFNKVTNFVPNCIAIQYSFFLKRKITTGIAIYYKCNTHTRNQSAPTTNQMIKLTHGTNPMHFHLIQRRKTYKTSS